MLTLTNARTNSKFAIAPAMIGELQERNDENYPNTKVALIKMDGSFIPVKEDIDTCLRMLANATRGQQQMPAQRQQSQGVQRPQMTDEEIASLDQR